MQRSSGITDPIAIQRITLSVCMIVKNEAEVLEECLRSVVSFADELVIVDTGSTDATKEIALRFTDKVYDHKWTDDFSEARNRSFSCASGDYVMWVDADHIIDDSEAEKLTELKRRLASYLAREEQERISLEKTYTPYVDLPSPGPGTEKIGQGAVNSICLNYLSPDNLNVPVSFHMIMKRGDGRKWTGAVHERYPLKEPVLYEDITIRHRERRRKDIPANVKSLIYRDYIRKIREDEFRECFWLGMQCYVDLILANEPEEAQRILQIAFETEPSAEELLRTCLLGGNNLLYWKRYADALRVYELFFGRRGICGSMRDAGADTPGEGDRVIEHREIAEVLNALPEEIRTSPRFRMLLQKAQKCAYESGGIQKAFFYNEILMRAFPDCVSARLNKSYYDSFHAVTLSVCMIVRDEEPVLERCLKKAVQFADEIIVVDTGSKDRTKEIAVKYTDKVYDLKWNDDFAAARNHSYEKAGCDYIMWMDADDDMEPEDIEKLIFLKHHFPPEKDVLLLYYTEDSSEEVYSGGELVRDRWIRRSLKAKWEYPIHEAIAIRKEWKVLYRPDIRIFHRKIQVNEAHRNIRIFERKLKEGFEMDTFNRAYYVRELTTEKRYEEARTAFESLWEDGSRRDIDYALVFYIETMKRLKQKKNLQKRLEEYTERFGADEMVYCVLGDLCRGEGRYAEAVCYYRMSRGLQIDPRDRKLHFAEYHDYLPWIGTAKAFLGLGDNDRAEDALRHAQRSHPKALEIKILKLDLENRRRKMRKEKAGQPDL